jgi:hypothetical protein
MKLPEAHSPSEEPSYAARHDIDVKRKEPGGTAKDTTSTAHIVHTVCR